MIFLGGVFRRSHSVAASGYTLATLAGCAFIKPATIQIEPTIVEWDPTSFNCAIERVIDQIERTIDQWNNGNPSGFTDGSRGLGPAKCPGQKASGSRLNN
jgi:hypothetical protein